MLNKNLLSGYHRRNAYAFLVYSLFKFGAKISTKDSQVCHIMVYGSKQLGNNWQKIHFFPKYMENMMTGGRKNTQTQNTQAQNSQS